MDISGDPKPGFYRMRLVARGPWVPVVVYWNCPLVPADYEFPPDEWLTPQDRSRFLIAEVDGIERDIDKVWSSLRPISEADYNLMRERAAWDRVNDPVTPAANPTRPLIINDLPARIRVREKEERSYWTQQEAKLRAEAAQRWREKNE